MPALWVIFLRCCIKICGLEHIVFKHIHGNSKTQNALPKKIKVSALNYRTERKGFNHVE